MTQEALKLALEALEEAWYHVGTFQPTEKAIDLYDEARAAIKEALAQTQEPVADDFFKMIADKNPKPFPLPQRTWVGLTEEEYKDLHLQMGPVYYYQEYGQAIEAKLKQKNGYAEEKNT